jgi:hypothetical protein
LALEAVEAVLEVEDLQQKNCRRGAVAQEFLAQYRALSLFMAVVVEQVDQIPRQRLN